MSAILESELITLQGQRRPVLRRNNGRAVTETRPKLLSTDSLPWKHAFPILWSTLGEARLAMWSLQEGLEATNSARGLKTKVEEILGGNRHILGSFEVPPGYPYLTFDTAQERIETGNKAYEDIYQGLYVRALAELKRDFGRHTQQFVPLVGERTRIVIACYTGVPSSAEIQAVLNKDIQSEGKPRMTELKQSMFQGFDIDKYEPIIKRTAHQLSSELLVSGFSIEDGEQEIRKALAEAWLNYDPAIGSFLTYALARCRGSVLDMLRRNFKPGRGITNDRYLIESFETQYNADHDKTPFLEEIAEETGLSAARVIEVKQGITTVSIEGTHFPDDDGSGNVPLSVMIPDNSFLVMPENRALVLEEQQELMEALKSLSPRQAQIVKLYYFDRLTMKEIAKKLQIAESRVCQLHKKILTRLREQLTSV